MYLKSFDLREDVRFLRGINSRTDTNRVESRPKLVVGKIAGKEFRQQHIARGGEHPSLPQKCEDIAVCCERGSRNQHCPGQQFFSRTAKLP